MLYTLGQWWDEEYLNALRTGPVTGMKEVMVTYWPVTGTRDVIVTYWACDWNEGYHSDVLGL